jgi:hypothetical protein
LHRLTSLAGVWQRTRRANRDVNHNTRLVSALLRNQALEVAMNRRVGISNRESADAEDHERREHPPVETSSPPPQDAAGHVGESPMKEVPNRQTSHKAGSRSIAQKEDRARYPDRSAPPSRKKAGAFGKEPAEVSAGNPNAEE